LIAIFPIAIEPLNRGIEMRVFPVLLVSAAAIFATSLSAQARGCDRRCLERRIAGLEAQIAQLNASTIKTGQFVTINTPTGCLSWGGPTPGSVYWVNPPCGQSTWVINGQ
jgi:hypothetical protein